MKYMGSKARIAKHILPIMLEEAEKKGITTWVEPFVGGSNMIKTVPKQMKRIGYDKNVYLIEMYKHIQKYGFTYTEQISKGLYDECRNAYNTNSWHVGNQEVDASFIGWVGFMASANGRFFDGGYSGISKTKIGTERNYIDESIRGLKKEFPDLQDVTFISEDYLNLDFENCLIYCFNEDTELLTDKGWLNIKDITTDDECLSREPNSSKLKYKKVVKTHQTKSQRMFYYKSKMLDFSITDDHNMFVNKKLGRVGNRKDMFIKPKDLDNYNFQFVNAGGIWSGVTPNKMHVGEFEVDTVPFMYLLGIFFSDGSVNNQKSVTISQKKPKIIEKIRRSLNELGLPYSEYLDSRGGVTTFYFKKSWSIYFEQFYLKSERKIPRDILNFGTDALEKLLDGILDGDSDNERRRVYTGSMTSVNDIQEILYKCGFASNYKVMKPKNSKLSCGRVIVGKEYYVVNILKTEYLDANEKNACFVDEEKDVYCVTLEDWHTVLTRQNGKVVWMGQCDPPYKGTKTYNTSKNFDHDKFFEWCREQTKRGNVVFVSEYEAPEDFVCVWQQEVKSSLSANGVSGGNKVSVEKLFKVPN